MTGVDGRRSFSGQYQVIASDVVMGKRVRISSFVNLYGCRIGDDTTIGAFVEIQAGASVGARCKISSHSFLCDGVTIEDGCFVGHSVTFINDRLPRALTPAGDVQGTDDWDAVPTLVAEGASIGSGATIMGGVTIGAAALVAAGAVVTSNVPPGMMAVGVPARVVGPAPDAPDSERGSNGE